METSRLTLYHNPRCSKSRQTLELLRSRGIEPRIVEYLKTPLLPDEVAHLIDLLGIEPHALLRTKEKAYGEAGLSATSDRATIVAALARYPVLLERPIVVHGNRAAIGRPPENVLALLS